MLRRYLFMLDSSQPLRWVDRYLSGASLEQRTSGLALAYLRGPERMAPANPTNASIRERIREQAALTQRLAQTDLFAPSQWAVESASAIEAHAELSPRVRAFFAAPHTSTDQLVLCADVEGAADALAAARSASMTQIAAMAPAAQVEAVRAMWRNFAAYFDRLGIRVDGWARYRQAVAAATGCDEGQDALSTFLLSPSLGRFPEGYDLLFDQRPRGGPAVPAAVRRVEELLRAPPPTPPWSPEVIAQVRATSGATLTPMADSPVVRNLAWGAALALVYRAASPEAPPSWRAMAAERYAAVYGGTPSQVMFGTPDEVEAAGHNVYRLWITETGRLIEGDSDPAHYDRTDCVMRRGAEGLPPSMPGFNWMCGAISRDPQGRCYYLAPLFWYAQLLQPLLAYLATRDPLEVVHEVELDVLGKNLWTVIATGRGEATLAQLGASRPLASAADAAARFAAFQGSFSTTIATVAGTAALINPVFGAVVGLGGAALGLFASATQAPPPRPASDCFFRFEPVVEYLQIREGGIRAWQCSETDPPTPLTLAYHGDDSWRPPTSSVARIVGMPEGGNVYLDGAAAPLPGRWTSTPGTWEVDVPSGTHTLRVTDAAGNARYAAVSLRPGVVFASLWSRLATAPVTVPSMPSFAMPSVTSLAAVDGVGGALASLQPLRVAGLPPYAATWIDGQRTDDARGSWQGDAWVIPNVAPGAHVLVAMPRTPSGEQAGLRRAVRVVTKSGAPTTVAWSAMIPEPPPPPPPPGPVAPRDLTVRSSTKASVWVAGALAATVTLAVVVYAASKPRQRNGTGKEPRHARQRR